MIEPISKPYILKPTEPTVAPGDSIELELTLTNDSNTMEHYTVQAQGIDSAWLAQPILHYQLVPNGSSTTSIILTPSPTATAGAYSGDVLYSHRLVY